jgi:Major Facilitator Superfamily
VAVAIAFADSSVVVLALPELYTRFDTSIEGVSWVITAYNAAVAVGALALVLFVHRLRAAVVLASGLLLFTAASIGCAAAGSLSFLIAARCVQGVGAALLLAGALPVLVVLTGSVVRGATVWTLAGTRSAASSRRRSAGGRSSRYRLRLPHQDCLPSSPPAQRLRSRKAGGRRCSGRCRRTPASAFFSVHSWACSFCLSCS